MEISKINNTNFCAKRISMTEVRKLNLKTKSYCDDFVSFVEINPKDENDFNLLKKIKRNWTTASFINGIFDTAKDISNNILNNKNSKIYALTTQKDKFEKINPKSVLGMADIAINDDFVTIVYLQVKPKYISGKPSQEYRNVGTGLMDGIKYKFRNKELSVFSTYSAMPFYENQNFQHITPNSKNMYWVKEFDGMIY